MERPFLFLVLLVGMMWELWRGVLWLANIWVSVIFYLVRILNELISRFTDANARASGRSVFLTDPRLCSDGNVS